MTNQEISTLNYTTRPKTAKRITFQVWSLFLWYHHEREVFADQGSFWCEYFVLGWTQSCGLRQIKRQRNGPIFLLWWLQWGRRWWDGKTFNGFIDCFVALGLLFSLCISLIRRQQLAIILLCVSLTISQIFYTSWSQDKRRLVHLRTEIIEIILLTKNLLMTEVKLAGWREFLSWIHFQLALTQKMSKTHMNIIQSILLSTNRRNPIICFLYKTQMMMETEMVRS